MYEQTHHSPFPARVRVRKRYVTIQTPWTLLRHHLSLFLAVIRIPLCLIRTTITGAFTVQKAGVRGSSVDDRISDSSADGLIHVTTSPFGKFGSYFKAFLCTKDTSLETLRTLFMLRSNRISTMSQSRTNITTAARRTTHICASNSYKTNHQAAFEIHNSEKADKYQGRGREGA